MAKFTQVLVRLLPTPIAAVTQELSNHTTVRCIIALASVKGVDEWVCSMVLHDP